MTYQPHHSEDLTTKPVAPAERPRCAVRGMIRPGAMCGSVIVGMEFCGFKGECPHKRTPGVTVAPAPCDGCPHPTLCVDFPAQHRTCGVKGADRG